MEDYPRMKGTDTFENKVKAVVDEITQKIRDGELKPGDQLPSTNQLLSHYGTRNLRIVQTARNDLKHAGLVESRGEPGRRGLYTFVCPNAPEKLK